MPLPIGGIDRLPVDYLSVPEEFRDVRGKWHQLAEYVDNNGIGNVSLFPRPGVDPHRAWLHIKGVLELNVPSYQKYSVAAWAFWTAFSDVKYKYD